jgi:hypothetical protein
MPKLTSTRAFLDWAHDVYLSEPVLMKASKKAVVVGMRDLDHAGARERFFVWSFTPFGKKVRWELEGTLDTDAEVTFEIATDVDAKVALRFRAGGVALLACDAIEVKEEPAKLRKARPRPWQSSFTVWSDDTAVTVARLLALLGLDALATIGKKKAAAKSWTLASLEEREGGAWVAKRGGHDVVLMTPVFRCGEPGWTLELQRGEAATDDDWDRAWRLPLELPVKEVRSRTVHTDARGWSLWAWRTGAKS